MTSEEDVFIRLSAAFQELRRGGINPFLKPRTMHHVGFTYLGVLLSVNICNIPQFQMLSLEKSNECVGRCTTKSIPFEKEVLEQEYILNGCSPALVNDLVPSDLFVHVFLSPGDHPGSMVAEMLPQKLRSKISERVLSLMSSIHLLIRVSTSSKGSTGQRRHSALLVLF